MTSERICFRTTVLQRELVATIADELGVTASAAVEWLVRDSLMWMMLWDPRLGPKLVKATQRVRADSPLASAQDMARAEVDKGLYDPHLDDIPY